MIGETVSHYRIIGKLGGGGMGIVYLAEDTRLGRKVAIKFLPPKLSENERAVRRFQREAKAVSALNHANICVLYDVGTHEGRDFIVMEALEGAALNDKIAESELPLDEVIELSIQICDALDAAHSKGVVHRDLKPANIFVTERGQAKVLDFGLAKLVPGGGPGDPSQTGADFIFDSPADRADEDPLTDVGNPMGTLCYMSPEQARGEDLDARTDVFSLGAVVYEMVTGRLAFGGNPAAVVYDAILNRSPTSLRSLRKEQRTEQLEPIIAKALDKDRRSRYQSAAQMLTDLKTVRAGRASASAPAPALDEAAFHIIMNDQEIPLNEGENLIGRTRTARIRLDASGVSRRHALIEVHGEEAVVHDCGSKNGTSVKGNKIDAPLPLVDGDEIKIGPVRMIFRSLSDEENTKTTLE